ncbi:kinase-like domain-containing protein, partial [Cladochytrium replicatum]
MPAPRIRRGDLLYDPALHCIGEGSTSIVFKAEWLGANVAVKALKFAPSRLTNNLDSFHREAERISILRHPNIIHFYGAVLPNENDNSDEERSDAPPRPTLWIDAFPVLVFEYAPLGSLAQYLAISKNRESLTLQLAYRIASQVANGMCYLHTREPPIIHGDLRPTNVLLMSDYSVKLADFGFSKVNWTFTGGNALNSASLSLAGAMRYMAPERLEGNSPDRPADVYSFAMTLYELF